VSPSEPSGGTDARRLRVAMDATPLIGRPTGVGAFCAGALGALGARADVSMSAFAVSWRRRGMIAAALPAGVPARQRAMPARPLHLAWRRSDLPPLEWFVGAVDVVHGSNFIVPPTHNAARVVTVHDLTTVRFPELCERFTLVFPDLVRRAVARGAWVHTPSQFVADEVVETLGVAPERVRAVHSGVPPVAPPDPVRRGAAALRALGASAPEVPAGTERYVLAIGTAEPRKDLPGLVDAFGRIARQHPDVALVLAGPDGWGTPALVAAIEASSAGTRVLRTGWLDDAALAGLLHGAEVLAYPSLYEGFGFPPLQAMAAGVPVVASRAGAVPEIVGDAASLVDPGDVDGLAGALEGLLDSEELRRSQVARGRLRAAPFTWTACASGLVDLYWCAAAGRVRR
jgi:glycosyltransferase involved in cell wall biosynthesis